MRFNPQKTISIFGATGSIGQSARDVILAHAERFDVQTVSAHSKVQELAQIAIELKARRAVIADENLLGDLRQALAGSDIEGRAGAGALINAAEESVDLHLAAIVGMAGLEPLFAALKSAKAVAIANKEPLVAAGALVMETAAEHNCKILPLDSEHNAIFQVLEESNRPAIEKIILTASGGPFLDWETGDIAKATPAQAIAHPNWSMGQKISVDSASMMNKALEVIEAHYLFNMPPEKIEVLIHPQSIIHSMVEYADGSVLAQMGASDMRTPISYALGWPERIATPGRRLDFAKISGLDFQTPDTHKFPALALAYEALKAGQGACIALNAANEVAVQAFLDKQIIFGDILSLIREALFQTQNCEFDTLESILRFDKEVRNQVQSFIVSRNNKEGRTAS